MRDRLERVHEKTMGHRGLLRALHRGPKFCTACSGGDTNAIREPSLLRREERIGEVTILTPSLTIPLPTRSMGRYPKRPYREV